MQNDRLTFILRKLPLRRQSNLHLMNQNWMVFFVLLVDGQVEMQKKVELLERFFNSHPKLNILKILMV